MESCTRPAHSEDEMQYLNHVREIILTGSFRYDPTGEATISLFGTQMLYNLRNGDVGPVYGFQWRHFGAKYIDMNTDYSGQGIDQLQNVIEQLRTSPTDRRIILSSWNPSDIPLMALPSHHCLVQFYVSCNELSCQIFQGSADMGLGVPFNITIYGLLTHMIAHVVGLKTGDLVHSLGDSHIFIDYIDALKIQMGRKPRPFPKILSNSEISDISDFQFQDIEVKQYYPLGALEMPMAV